MFIKLIELLSFFIISSISLMGYWGVGLMMAIESACVPLPSEIIMPFSGYLVFRGEMTMLGITLAGAAGTVLGSVLAYWAGAFGGRSFIEKYGKYILISRQDLDLADRFFTKYGGGTVFFSRMLPVVRTFISLPAGIAKMPFVKFVAYTFLGSLPWGFALGYVGKKMGENWDKLGGYFHKFDLLIGAVMIIGAVWYVRRHLRHRKEEATALSE